jgi:uncharacterized protein
MTAIAMHPRSALTRVRPRVAAGSALAVGALSVVALHVADDSFLQPNPGTSAGDHLAGGLVPIALLGAAAFAYPRVRPGIRAVLALLLGLLALIVGAGEAAYDALADGPSGDDYSGLLALPAGVVLLALGVATLWRSRRLDDSRRRRYLRRALLAAAGVVTLASVVFPIAIAYPTTHILRRDVPEAQLGVPYEDVSFTTSDGLELEGWYVPSRNGAAVIAFPGRSGPQKQARMLARNGYGVLLFDRRGEGASDGDPNIFGWGGDRDVRAAVEYLKSRPDVEPGRIGGIGLSVGGELMLQAAAGTDELAAVVSEGAGTRWLAEEVEELDTIPGWSKWLSVPTYVVKTAAVAVFSSTAPPPKLTDLVPRIHRPLLLIWAPNGGNMETMNPVYRDLAGGPASIWAIPDAKHIGGITAHPREYERRVVGFFDRALLDAGSPS